MKIGERFQLFHKHSICEWSSSEKNTVLVIFELDFTRNYICFLKDNYGYEFYFKLFKFKYHWIQRLKNKRS